MGKIHYQFPRCGSLQREGTMRLATAMDEIAPLNDVRVQNNPAYLIIILLSRVITRIGSVSHVNPKVIEGLYAADLAYLQKLFNRINQLDDGYLSASCPLCHHTIKLELVGFHSNHKSG
ncbi:MAG: phage tail assembly protein [Bdellovibrio sp.]|nr:phage tail assembly protein [Methylotenera sp.]